MFLFVIRAYLIIWPLNAFLFLFLCVRKGFLCQIIFEGGGVIFFVAGRHAICTYGMRDVLCIFCSLCILQKVYKDGDK